MSAKKNKLKKTSAHKNVESPTATHPVKRFGLPVLWVTILAVGLWALMNFSTPSNNLVPYDQIKQSKNDAAEEPSTSKKPEKVSTELEENISDLVKQASNTPEPRDRLPRATLEHIAKGMDLTEQGKSNQADIEFGEAAKISPDSHEVYSIWGAALKMQKKYKGANKKFAKAHALAPDDSEVVFNWAMSTLEQRDSEEAVRLFTKSIEMEPANYLAYNYLGKAYGQKKLYDQEIASYEKAISMNPQFAPPHFNLGVVLSIQKKFEKAAPHFEKAIAIDKSFEKPFVVQMLTALGRYKTEKPKSAKKEDTKPEPVQEAKVDIGAELKKSLEEKSEGSDHKMEGSKNVKETTNVKGRVLVNGKPLSPLGVVFLETKSKLRVPEQKALDVTVKQTNLQFFPKHTVVPVGSKITFANEDREVHNIFSKSSNNQFNLGAMAAGSSKSITLDQPGPIILRCNMHKDMIGTIFVVPNGYYTHTDTKGEYSFANVKSQGYLLEYWHPQLIPEEVETNMKQVDLKGVDQSVDFDIKSASKPGEIHDLVDPTDYNTIVDHIEKEVLQAIQDWKAGKKSIPRKRMLMAITKHYDGEGLKGALAKSFSQKRSMGLERKLDAIRKDISGIGVSKGEVTEESLTSKAKFVISQLRNNVQELEARLNPDFNKKENSKK
jgi:tetratricopeptide (TPR) repeat protein/plastocyanin